MSKNWKCFAFSSNYVEYKSNGDRSKILSIRDYLDETRPYLTDIINDHKTQGERKVHLTMTIIFFSYKDFEETHIMNIKSDNIEIKMGNETDKIM